MKIDVVQRFDQKKDLWDIHNCRKRARHHQMIALHKQRYPYVCLRSKYRELIKLDIMQAMGNSLTSTLTIYAMPGIYSQKQSASATHLSDSGRAQPVIHYKKAISDLKKPFSMWLII